MHPPAPSCSGPGLDLGPITGHNPIGLREQLTGWDPSKPLSPSITDSVRKSVWEPQSYALWGFLVPLKDQLTEVTPMEEKNLETQQFHLLNQLKYMKENSTRVIP